MAYQDGLTSTAVSPTAPALSTSSLSVVESLGLHCIINGAHHEFCAGVNELLCLDAVNQER